MSERPTEPAAPHYFGDGCPDDSAEHWREVAEWTSAELARITGIYNGLLASQSQFERDTKATEHVEARTAALGHAYWHVLKTARLPLRALVSEVLALPDKPSPHDLAAVRGLATGGPRPLVVPGVRRTASLIPRSGGGLSLFGRAGRRWRPLRRGLPVGELRRIRLPAGLVDPDVDVVESPPG